jgi:molybdenum cofactor biosynthesis protein B
MAKVLSINISEKKGEIKIPIKQGEFIKDFGLKEDSHAAAWHRQVSLLAKESIDYMRDKSRNVELNFGDFAENITTEGVTLHKLPVGTILEIGEVVLKVSQIGKECHHGCKIMEKTGSCIMPTQGIFATVEQGGIIKEGDEINIKVPAKDKFSYAIIIVSDKGSQGLRQDGCKQKIVNVLDKEYVYEMVDYVIVPDEIEDIKAAIKKNIDNNTSLILTSGGTGFAKRDVTPEATLELIQRQTYGISEYIRAKSLEKTNRAILSRAVSGIANNSLIINLPGSPIAVEESLNFIIDPLKHGLEILLAKDAECAR